LRGIRLVPRYEGSDEAISYFNPRHKDWRAGAKNHEGRREKINLPQSPHQRRDLHDLHGEYFYLCAIGNPMGKCVALFFKKIIINIIVYFKVGFLIH